jgi:transposase
LRRQRLPAGRRLSQPEAVNVPLTPEQRLLALDAWRRSKLPAGDFAPLVGVSKHTLYAWKHKFDSEGPAGLLDHPRGAPTGSRLPEVTRRAILMLKEANPDWGCERIAAMLLRGPALPAGPEAVARVLREAGYVLEETPTRPTALLRAGPAEPALANRFGAASFTVRHTWTWFHNGRAGAVKPLARAFTGPARPL